MNPLPISVCFFVGLLVVLSGRARKAGWPNARITVVIVWIVGTFVEMALAWLMLLGYGITRTEGDTDESITHSILFGPMYLLPIRIALTVVCLGLFVRTHQISKQ